MTQRIRYIKTGKDGILESIKNLRSDSTDASYKVVLDTTNCKFVIKNVNSGRNYEGGDNINNLHVLKRKVKEKLSKLGVDFAKEIRDNSSRIAGVNCSYKRNRNEG